MVRSLKLIFVFTLSCAAIAQEPSPPMRYEAQKIHLEKDITIGLGSARQALAEILRSAQVAGGIVELSGCGEPAQSPITISVSHSLASALDLLTTVYPEYYWSIRDRSINLLPKGIWPAAMNIHIPRLGWNTAGTVDLSVTAVLDVDGVRTKLARNAFTAALETIPGLRKPPRIVNGVPEASQPGKYYEIEDVTVLAALNAIAVSYGSAIWWYEERVCDGKKTYSLMSQDLRTHK